MQARYGSDRNGLIFGFRFLPGAPGEPIGLEQAAAWLREPGAAAGFVWLHLNLSDAAAKRWISELDVEPEFIDALREGSRSPRIEDAHGTLIAAVNDIAYEFAFDPSEIETLWAPVMPRLAMTARVHRCARSTGCASRRRGWVRTTWKTCARRPRGSRSCCAT